LKTTFASKLESQPWKCSNTVKPFDKTDPKTIKQEHTIFIRPWAD